MPRVRAAAEAGPVSANVHPTSWGRQCPRCGLIGVVTAPTEHTPPGSTDKPAPNPPAVAWTCPCGKRVELNPAR